MRLVSVIVAVFALGAAVNASAQQVVGSSLIDGRPVQLMSDFTWKYLTSAPAGCETVQGSVAFCGGKGGWTRTSQTESDIAAQYRLDDKDYGEFIVENIGADDGVTPEAFSKLVIQNAASAAKVQPKDINTFGVEPAVVDGIQGTTVAYGTKISDIAVIFINTIVMEHHRTTQVVTFHIGGNITDSMKAIHKSFLAATRLK